MTVWCGRCNRELLLLTPIGDELCRRRQSRWLAYGRSSFDFGPPSGYRPGAGSCTSLTDRPSEHESPPVLELPGGWCAELLTADEWRDAVSAGPLQRFAGFEPRTPFVYVIFKRAPNSQPGEASADVEGTFVAPCAVPEDDSVALFVALINAMAYEALESVQVDGEPLFRSAH